MRGIGTRLSRDDGMTLVEVVVSAAILFFIATGVLGLLGRSVSISIEAKSINVSTNAVNSYVEWARSLELAQIDGGSLDTTTIVTGEYTVTIEPTVEIGENAALRNVTLRVTTRRGTQTPTTYQTMVIIRDRNQHLTEGQRSPLTDPKIAFISPTPPDGTVVWYDGGSWWQDSGGSTQPLKIAVKVTPSSGRTIDLVEILGHNAWPLEDTMGNFAQWEDPTWTNSPVFYWNLDQRTALDEPLVLEGTREVNAWVTDSAGARGPDARRTFIVDNLKPQDAPTPLTHTLGATMAGKLSWAMVPDGSDPSAYGYELALAKQGLGVDSWTGVTGYTGPLTSWDVLAEPMSRYRCSAAAFGPRTGHGPWTAPTFFVTRPRLSGSFTVVRASTGPSKGWKVTPTLTATAPSFETTGTVQYKWYMNDALVGTTATNTWTGPTVTYSGNPDYTNFPVRAYHVVVTVTPAGDGGGTAVDMVSNKVATSAAGITASGTYTFPEGTW